MRASAMVMGILGGLLGVIFGFPAMIAGMEEAWLTWFLPLGGAAMAMGLAGLVGAALARSHPKPSWIIMGVAGVVFLLVISVSFILYLDDSRMWLWTLSGVLLIAGSALEFAGRKGKGTETVRTSPATGRTEPSMPKVYVPGDGSRGQNEPVDGVPVGAQPPSGSLPLVADEIAKLGKLREDGLITSEEFEVQKNLLLRWGPKPSDQSEWQPSPPAVG